MKKGILLLLAMATLGLTGCVKTVTENKAGGVPLVNDRVEGRYDRSVNEVFEASKRALASFGSVTKEGSLHTATNQVRTVEGFVNQSSVWMRIEEVTPSISSVLVQVRTKWGAADIQKAHDLEKQVALELTAASR